MKIETKYDMGQLLWSVNHRRNYEWYVGLGFEVLEILIDDEGVWYGRDDGNSEREKDCFPTLAEAEAEAARRNETPRRDGEGR